MESDDDSEVERKYVAMLEQIGLPAHKVEQMAQSESMPKKRELIRAHQAMLSERGGGRGQEHEQEEHARE